MEGAAARRSGGTGGESDGVCAESFRFSEGIQRFMSVAPLPETGNSFKALLELPPTEAMELLHSTVSDEVAAEIAGDMCHELNRKPYLHSLDFSPAFLSKSDLVPPRFSIFGAGVDDSGGSGDGEKSTETMSYVPSSSSKVKNEPNDADWNLNSLSPIISDPTVDKKNQKSVKRKEREKRVKVQNKKGKSSGNESSGDAEKLPYVHVRARRGQATDSHSLAERVRREKINARMKLLQELVPGCNKISGTALVLDEIINHVQSLQHQVESLSMRLAAVNPRVGFNLETPLAAESGSLMDCNFPSMFGPIMWPEIQVNGNREQDHQSWQFDAYHQQPVWSRDEENHNFLTPDNSLLSYDDSANSVSLHSNQLKTEH